MTQRPKILPLPSGFKQVPSNPLFAVSKAGGVLNAQTLSPFIITRDGTDGLPYIRINKYDREFGRIEQETYYVKDLIKNAFGGTGIVVWRDIPDYEAYQISQNDGTVRNKKTNEIVPIELGREDTVLLFKSGRDKEPQRLSVWDLLKSAFPEDYTSPEPKEQIKDQSKMIKINNVPMAREALLQLKNSRTCDTYQFPGPLRDQTIWDLIDNLLTALDAP